MKRYVAPLMLVLALVLCGCDAAFEIPTEAPALTSYFLTVLDENARPVVGAMVRLGLEEGNLPVEEPLEEEFIPKG